MAGRGWARRKRSTVPPAVPFPSPQRSLQALVQVESCRYLLAQRSETGCHALKPPPPEPHATPPFRAHVRPESSAVAEPAKARLPRQELHQIDNPGKER